MSHTYTDPATVANVHSAIADETAALGISWMALARKSGVSYLRLLRGAALTDTEIIALESVLGPLPGQRQRAELSHVADRVIVAAFSKPNSVQEA